MDKFSMFDTSQVILSICQKYYTSETFVHAHRVATIVSEEGMIFKNSQEVQFAQNLAFAHDLFEDTDCPAFLFQGDFLRAMKLITHEKERESYEKYLTRIHEQRDVDDVGRIVWFVKLFDIKDHLIQTKTLTDKLKEKYLSGLRYLL